jgi:RHS repeat-associated protein
LLDGTDGGSGTQLRQFGYDGLGRLTDVVNSSGIPLVYGYDDADRITSWTDRNGYWYAYAYGPDGRVARGHGRDGVLAATFDYDLVDRVTTVTDSLGRATEFHFDEHCHITAVVDPLGHTVRTEHDRFGRLLSLVDELGRTTRHRYDARGDLVRVDHPDGTWTTAEYGDLGLPVRVTTPDGQVWRQAHDASGNRTEAADPTGAVTRFRYDESGRLTTVVDALGGTTTVRCNASGLPVQMSDPLGASTEWIRDAFGRPIAVTDPHGNIRRFRWSTEGRLLSRTAADGTTEQWTHDPEGNVLTYVDQIGSVTTMTYGAFGLPLARTAADGSTVSFTHDTELRVVQVANPVGLTWDYAYDAAGRTVGETDFDGVRIRYTHDAAGQLLSRSASGPTDTTASTVDFGYDLAGNLTEKSSDGASFSFGYDPVGRLVSASGPGCRLDRTLDPLGRITSETVNGRTMTLEHDPLGRRTSRSTPSGAKTRWAYDGAGNPVTLNASGHTVAFTHDALGREIGREIADGMVLSSAWDRLDRLSSRTLHSTRASAPLHHSAYTYRADGHPVSLESHDLGTRSFELDHLGRITSVRSGDGSGDRAASGPEVLESYAYDPAGNVSDSRWPGGAAGRGERSTAGSLLRQAGRIGFEHDGQGRTVQRRIRTLSGRVDTCSYVWDAEDRLVEAVTPGGTRWRYRYDPLGRRIAKERLSADGESVVEWTEFTWDGSLLVEQTAHGPALPGPYSLTWDHRGIHPVAQTERIALPSGEVDQRFFAIVTDLIGTPTQLVNLDGTTAWRARTTVWGADLGSAAGATTTPLRFPGQYHDPETRLHYNLYRYYDPSVGRYLSGDPLGLAPGPNPYAYVDNPMVWADPLGLSAFTPLNLGTSRFWTPVDYRGQRVYQRDDLMNPGYVSPRDKYGRSNLKRMTQGLAPMGPDDKPVNLHHMLQTQDGPIAEVTQSMHLAQGDYKDSGSYNTLHWKAGTKIPSGIDREAFDDWKSDYWKDRARGLSGGGCGT